ncbi:glycosyltransferase family 2 protein [Marivirga harenae]|uniref:glycosyltransferase family 2 protein n=1 Tax=Marivirga harenae TaxID=2010992 RepID=UPI0026E02378|nr:glycosyltransferase family 2 protein [Marivirga harenae]WKV13128.1 glycosyltransferase family 2 protein [Marivirga harenae]|tara:strand:- start:273650 stop:274426 length:777 start_codon:yes stop_codon:yes gene_type:complete
MESENAPLVSIITPCYNSELFLESTIKSIIDQEYNNWELLIVDDSSTDNSRQIISSFSELDSRIKPMYLSKNSGRIYCRNIAIEQALGKYIIHIDSDDIWYENILSISVKIMEEENISFLFSSYDRFLVSKKQLISPRIAPEKVTLDEICKSNPISCLTAIYNSHKLGKRYFSKEFEREDLVLWLSLLKDVDYAYGNSEILAKYNIRKGSVSENKFRMLGQQWDVYRNYLGFSPLKSLYYLSYYAAYGLINYRKALFR